MKILFITDQTYLHGGVEKVLSTKANFFAKNEEDEVFVVTHNQSQKKPCYEYNESVRFFDLDVNYDISRSYFSFYNLKKIFNHKKKLQNLINKISPDIIIHCSISPDFYFLPYLQRNIPKIKEFHSSRYFVSQQKKNFKDRFLHQFTKYTEKKYHHLVLLNQDEVVFYHNKNIVVIPNPVEVSEEISNLDSKKILAAGRISPVKNFEDVIAAFSKISGKFQDWELHFYGEDYINTQEKLQKIITNHNLQKQIKFMGISHDIKATMKNYSIYAMTSHTECFPMVLLESLSMGLPIVTYNSPTGPSNIVTHRKDSLLVEYKNIEEFAENLSLLMDDDILRKKMGITAKQNSHKFETEKVMNLWTKLFIHLLK